MTQIALTIAGSDSSGGAGIQADLHTFAVHSVHGASVITCVTAQNTLGVTKVEAISRETIVAQIEAVTLDLRVDAVKTGMLLEEKIIRAIASFDFPNLVVDPVMVSRTGARLIDQEAIASLQELLLPKAVIITKNTHGTGCTLSAAICANLALGKDLWSSVIEAKKYVTIALQHSLDIGAGNGPVGHFFSLIAQT
ncbi:MAG: bifunctional hydroxymethylpyrimidine kinase/phosphomethylpyrimidine kinase [Pleurocapsa sp.]